MRHMLPLLAFALVPHHARAEGVSPLPAPPSVESAVEAKAQTATDEAVPAFEGDILYDVTIDGERAAARAQSAGDGSFRLDLEYRDPALKQTLRTTVVVLGGNLNEAFYILHPTRTFSRLALSTPSTPDPARFRIAELGAEEVLGRKARHVKVTDEKSGDELDLWLDRDLGSLALPERIYRALLPASGQVGQALSRAGVDGFPLRFRLKRGNGPLIEGVAAHLEHHQVDGGLFAPPRGYIRVDMADGQLPPIPGLTKDPLKGASQLLNGVVR